MFSQFMQKKPLGRSVAFEMKRYSTARIADVSRQSEPNG
jgi:hypothetical protein